MLLSDNEVKELTGKIRRPSQVSVLMKMGVKHMVRPDGSVAVLKSHIDRILDDLKESQNKRSEPNWDGM